MKTSRSILSTVGLVALLLIFAGMATAQTSTTFLQGTITDASGAAVVNATVTLVNAESKSERNTVTGSQGEYRFQALPPGTYTLTVTAKGFARQEVKGLQLLVNTPATENLQLKVGGTTETVSVTSEAPPLNMVDASLGTPFNQTQVRELPLDGRNVPELLSLQAGVVFTGNTLNTSLAAYKDQDTRNGAVNGARSDQSNITLDGVDVNDQNSGYAFTSVLPITQDSVQEFRVTTTNYNAEEGTGSGAEVALITRSGTNNWHGSAYEYLRNTITSANDYLTKRAELSSGESNEPLKLIRNVFGGTLGGPIIKNRLFFFYNYEGTRLREQQSVVRNIPTTSLRDGVMIYQCTPLADGSADTAACPGGSATGVSGKSYNFAPGFYGLNPTQIAALDPLQIPITANSYMIKYFAQTYGNLVTNDASVGDGFNYSGYRWRAPFNLNNNANIARIDYNLTAKGTQTLFWRGAIQNLNNPQAPFLPGTAPMQTLVDFSKGMAVGYTVLIGSSKVNTFRYGFTRQSTGYNGNSNQEWNTFYTLDNSFAYSHNFQMPVNNFMDDFSWTRGKHTIQVGVGVGIARDPRTSQLHSFSQGKGATFWMAPVGFANTANTDPAKGPVCNSASAAAGYTAAGSPLDPCYGNFPAPYSSSAYDYPMLGLLGMASLVNSNWNYTKDGTALPQGTPVKRNYGLNWYEFYGQDSWKFKPNWTLNLGLRWSIFPPPWETNGLQASPTCSPAVEAQNGAAPCPSGTFNMGSYFNQNVQNMHNGLGFADAPLISFIPGGSANNGPGFYNTQKTNFSPRISVAYSPRAKGGLLQALFGGADQTVIRGGFSIVYDRAGMQLINTFDANAPAGYSTSLTNPCCVDGAATVPRITDIHDVESLTNQSGTPYFQQAPGGTFPQTPPSGYPGGQAITWGIDQSLKTPYAYAVDFSVGRELSHGFSLQVAYVGRFGRNLLTQRDLMQPLDLVDPVTKIDYYTAATAFSKLASSQGIAATQLSPTDFNKLLGPTAAYWSNLLKASGSTTAPAPGTVYMMPVFDQATKTAQTPTTSIAQAAYALYVSSGAYAGDEVVGLGNIDLYGYLVDSSQQPYYFNGKTGEMLNQQFTTSYGWSSIGNSNYNGLQLTLKKQLRNGVQFDFNYTYSKSIDITSAAARLNFSGTDNIGAPGSRLVNAFAPNQFRAVSDFDTTHQINANWVADLPFGKGKAFGRNANTALDAVIGGWQLNGLVRWTSGFPFTVDNGQFWATNWDEQGSAQMVTKPKTGVFKNPTTGTVSVFADPATALNDFVHPFPGQSGTRNGLRGDGYASWDMALSKRWKMPWREGHTLQFRWEVFNVANLTRFNVLAGLGDGAPSLQQSNTSFGNYAGLLTNPRVMQFGLRYDF